MTLLPTYVVIPFKDEPEMTLNLLAELRHQGGYDAILAFNNGSKISSIEAMHQAVIDDEKLRIFNRPDAGIYGMWNEGWRIAVEECGAVNVAILNNDIVIPPDFLNTMARSLRSDDDTWIVYPDYNRAVREGVADRLKLKHTQGTYQHGGMSGWAFMLRGEAVNRGLSYVDEQFEWWYGDDDLVRSVTAAGKKVCRVVGLPLDHLSEATARNGENEWTHEAKVRDTKRFHDKWS